MIKPMSYLIVNDMVIFAEVVKQHGFTAASHVLGLPKSNISRRIKRLETHLGERLLERSTRQLHLTEIGEIYFRHCVHLLEEIELAETAVQQMQTIPKGLLKVSASITLGKALVAPYLAQFMKQHPAIQVQLLLTNRRVALIEEGFDVAIRLGKLEDSNLVVRGLGQSCMTLYAAPNYLSEQGYPTKLEDLAQHDVLMMNDSWKSHFWNFMEPQKRTIHLTPRFIVNDFATLHQMSLAGMGIALIPTYLCAEDVAAGHLVRILPAYSPAPVQVSAVYPSHRGAMLKTRVFLDFLSTTMTPLLQR